MTAIEIVFGGITAVGVLATIGVLIHRAGRNSGRNDQRLEAAGIRMKAIAEVDKKVDEVAGDVSQIKFAILGGMGSSGFAARIDSIEERLEAIEFQLKAGR